MKSKKGIGISINVLIVLAIAMIVLAGLVVMFTGSAGPGGETMKCQAKWNAACANYRGAGGCSAGEQLKEDKYFAKDGYECVGVSDEGEAADQCCQGTKETTTIE